MRVKIVCDEHADEYRIYIKSEQTFTYEKVGALSYKIIDNYLSSIVDQDMVKKINFKFEFVNELVVDTDTNEIFTAND